MSKLPVKSTIYVHDFEPSLTGLFEVKGQTSECRAYFYEVPENIKGTLEKINAHLAQLSQPSETSLVRFLLSLDSVRQDVSNLIFKEIGDLNNLEITSHHGHGLEAGFKAELKKEFRHSAKPAMK